MEQWLYIGGITVLALLIMLLYFRYHGQIERKLFSIRIHSPWRAFFSALLAGIIAALVASVVMIVLGIQVSAQTVLGIWGLALILSFFQLRYLSFTYAASIVGILAYVTQAGLIAWTTFDLFVVQEYFEQVLIRDLLATVGILYVMEALLFRWQRQHASVPAVFFGQRGRLVGGFITRRIGFLPLVVLLPSSAGWKMEFLPEWWPLFGNGDVSMVTVSILPIVLVYSSVVVSRMPQEQLRRASKWWLLFGLVIIALSYLADYLAWLVLVTAVIALCAKEMFIRLVHAREKKATSHFSHNNEGLAILAVLPESPAAEMGIVPGERLARVNGVKVTQTKEVYAALQHNAAFCKLEVINTAGNIKFLQRSLYSGEHYLLGIMLAPDEEKTTYLKSSYMNLFHLLLQKVNYRKTTK